MPTPAAAGVPDAGGTAQAQDSALVDRRIELAELTALLATPGCRLVTVVGPDGIGKSRLAVRAALTNAREPTRSGQACAAGIAEPGREHQQRDRHCHRGQQQPGRADSRAHRAVPERATAADTGGADRRMWQIEPKVQSGGVHRTSFGSTGPQRPGHHDRRSTCSAHPA
ncbi:MAG: ATP-binding protein [Nitrospira sp.]|nr:ATP-binding protein [Nitrospira sp.]